ncbi:MAG: alpha-1,2-fucosyltransferase [Alphaproteobacteria bacterium]
MFQYALGRRLALERGVPLLLDARWCGTEDLSQEPGFACRLHHLRIDAALAGEAQVRQVVPRPTTLHWRLGWLLPPRYRRVVQQRQFPFDPSLLRCGKDAYLVGYWQTERYFDLIAEVIRADFQLVAPMSERRMAIAARIKASRGISVHVRRGDYVSDPRTLKTHGVCSPEWYERAMAVLAEEEEAQGRTPSFFVFSDDPDWARENLVPRGSMTFIAPDPDGRDFEDLHLMAACRHHVTANSSFSWWGAWLNPDPDKRVIAPARWFADAPHDTRDLIPPSWTCLE